MFRERNFAGTNGKRNLRSQPPTFPVEVDLFMIEGVDIHDHVLMQPASAVYPRDVWAIVWANGDIMSLNSP